MNYGHAGALAALAILTWEAWMSGDGIEVADAEKFGFAAVAPVVSSSTFNRSRTVRTVCVELTATSRKLPARGVTGTNRRLVLS